VLIWAHQPPSVDLYGKTQHPLLGHPGALNAGRRKSPVQQALALDLLVHHELLGAQIAAHLPLNEVTLAQLTEQDNLSNPRDNVFAALS
jgi:hypothetical protein